MGMSSLLQNVYKGDASLERRSHPAGIIRFFRLGLTLLYIIIFLLAMQETGTGGEFETSALAQHKAVAVGETHA